MSAPVSVKPLVEDTLGSKTVSNAMLPTYCQKMFLRPAATRPARPGPLLEDAEDHGG
jgi:hypothetical protein